MPNHIHGIIGIVEETNVGTSHDLSLPICRRRTIVRTRHGMSLRRLSQTMDIPDEIEKIVSGSLCAGID